METKTELAAGADAANPTREVDEGAASASIGDATAPGEDTSDGDAVAVDRVAKKDALHKALAKATRAAEKSAQGARELPEDADEKARSKAARAIRRAAEALLAAADDVEDERPKRSLLLGRSWNKVELSEVFGGPNRTRPDWFFAVGDCHTESLDIRYMQPARGAQSTEEYWAESDRPCYTLAVGDTFYDSPAPLTPESRWGDVVGQIRYSVQVVEASPGALQDAPWPEGLAQPPIRSSASQGQLRRRRESEDYTHRTEVVEGTVRFELRHYHDGKPSDAWTSPPVTQREFTEFLRTGVLRGVLQNLPARPGP